MIKRYVTSIHHIDCDNLMELASELKKNYIGKKYSVFADDMNHEIDSDRRCALYDTSMNKSLDEFFVECEDRLNPYTTTYTITTK